MDIDVVLDAGAIIGESPTWCAAEGALYWIDVKRPALYRLDPRSQALRSWTVPSDLGGFALLDDLSGAVVAIRQGVFRLDFGSGGMTKLADPPFDPALHRFNEGACDATGRFWIGVMFDPLDPAAQPAQRSLLHSFTLDEGLRPESDASELHNGMAWSPDGRVFFLSHSLRHEILAHDFDPADGRVGQPRRFAQLAEGSGLPDGAAVDAEGAYWCALHGAGRLRRYRADGSVDREVALPVSQPTMCAFAGEHLDELYVTSASDKLDAEQRRREPLAGALLRLRPGVQGVVRRCTVR